MHWSALHFYLIFCTCIFYCSWLSDNQPLVGTAERGWAHGDFKILFWWRGDGLHLEAHVLGLSGHMLRLPRLVHSRAPKQNRDENRETVGNSRLLLGMNRNTMDGSNKVI